MGALSFDERYEAGELVRFDGIRTFAARDRASGQELLAHFLENSSENPAILANLDRLPEREKQRVVDKGEREGVPYIITGALAGYPGFREWLAASAKEPRPLDAAGAWKVVLPESNVDEQFLALFPTGEGPQASPEPALPSASQKPPGEFTQLFQAPLQPPPAPPIPSVQPPPPARPSVPAGTAPAASSEPGEFTRMFQAPPPQQSKPLESKPSEPKPPEPRKAEGKPESPGEFTRLFQTQSPPVPARNPQASPLPASAPPAHPSPSARPGEFTQFFESQGYRTTASPLPAGVPPLPTTPPAPKQGEFTKVFGPGEIRNLTPTPAPPPVQTPAPREPNPPASAFPSSKPATPPSGPGEYTRLFSAIPSLTLGQARPETPVPAPASHRHTAPAPSVGRSRWPLILGIAAVVVLVAVVILLVATRSK